jgi:hypothetical protein
MDITLSTEGIREGLPYAVFGTMASDRLLDSSGSRGAEDQSVREPGVLV